MTDNEKNPTSKSSLLDESKKKDFKGETKVKSDPTLVQHLNLNEDFYALSWNACRIDSWKECKVAGVELSLTSSDDTHLVLGFILFIIVVLTTLGILLYESFATDAYRDATWPIVILRMTLVCFAQQKLKPEINQGFSLMRYSFLHSEQFIHPIFSKLIGFFQASIAIVTFCAIFLFCCMADQALDLIMNFAGLAVISELDDWVGEQIMSEKLHCDYEGERFKNTNLNVEDLNERMSLFTKLCVIGEAMELVDDQNKMIINSRIWSFFAAIGDMLPWSLVPLLTLPTQMILIQLQRVSTVPIHEKKE